MALSKAKQAAINSVYEASDELRKYRGLPLESMFDHGAFANPKHTIADLKHQAEVIMNMTHDALEPATEKQLNFLSKLINGRDNGLGDMNILIGLPFNKYQASELIEFCLYVQKSLQVNFRYISEQDCDDMDKEMNNLIKFYTNLLK